MDAVGFYERKGGFSERQLQVKQETAKALGLQYIVLRLNSKHLMTHVQLAYYHLDMFVTYLPDERLLITNKYILSKELFKCLQEVFGEKIIDLSLPDYMPTNINILPVKISATESVLIMDSQLDYIESMIETETGCRVVSKNCFNPGHHRYAASDTDEISLEILVQLLQ